ncbi:MAG: isochorismatase family protein, partial [Ethanoligenens sp.]
NNINKLYFVGIDTDCCVLKSATDCFERNIPFEVLINYCATNGGKESQDAAIRVMQRTIGKKNINSSM